MTDSHLPQSVLDRIYAERNGLLKDALGRSIGRILDSGIRDDFAQGELSDRVRRHRIKRAFQGEFPRPRLSSGELILGVDQSGRPLRCPVQVLNAHALTLGGSGSGKTTKSRFLALQIVPRLRGAWLFDFRKREFASLRPFLARAGVDLIVCPGRMLRLNCLQVPAGVVPLAWAASAAEMLVGCLGVPERAAKLVHAAVVSLYEQRGVLGGSVDYPTLFDLREAIARDPRANPQAREAFLDSVDPVLLSVGDVFRYRVGWTSHDLAQRRIVFEIGGLAERDKNLILNTLLLSEFMSRVAGGVSNPGMDLWICCDEAARLVSTGGSNGAIADMIGLVRGTGIGLDLSVQSADVAPAVLSNTATKVIGRCGSATDYDAMAAAMGLSAEQRQWLRTHLEPGLFVGQLGEGSWREPFVFRIPPMRLSDVAVDSSPEPMGDLHLLPSRV